MDKSLGLICDQTVLLNGYQSSKDFPAHLRRVRVRDLDSGKAITLLSNNMSLPAHTIAQLYKSRWQVELFFKWIKQHLRIKRFLGNSDNAVRSQIWCAIATYVLIAIAKKELKIKTSLYTCLQILSVSVFEKSEISCALQPGGYNLETPTPEKQLILLGF